MAGRLAGLLLQPIKILLHHVPCLYNVFDERKRQKGGGGGEVEREIMRFVNCNGHQWLELVWELEYEDVRRERWSSGKVYGDDWSPPQLHLLTPPAPHPSNAGLRLVLLSCRSYPPTGGEKPENFCNSNNLQKSRSKGEKKWLTNKRGKMMQTDPAVHLSPSISVHH